MKTAKQGSDKPLSQTRNTSGKNITSSQVAYGISLNKKKFLSLRLREEDAVFSMMMLFFRKTL